MMAYYNLHTVQLTSPGFYFIVVIWEFIQR